ncbi:hypothetical protein H6504_01925 [Candidatus Woesearchaeota archaeon]|nr:hypothetical protein [Candidatus Woesearchaeota archaeon]
MPIQIIFVLMIAVVVSMVVFQFSQDMINDSREDLESMRGTFAGGNKIVKIDGALDAQSLLYLAEECGNMVANNPSIADGYCMGIKASGAITCPSVPTTLTPYDLVACDATGTDTVFIGFSAAQKGIVIE